MAMCSYDINNMHCYSGLMRMYKYNSSIFQKPECKYCSFTEQFTHK